MRGRAPPRPNTGTPQHLQLMRPQEVDVPYDNHTAAAAALDAHDAAAADEGEAARAVRALQCAVPCCSTRGAARCSPRPLPPVLARARHASAKPPCRAQKWARAPGAGGRRVAGGTRGLGHAAAYVVRVLPVQVAHQRVRHGRGPPALAGGVAAGARGAGRGALAGALPALPEPGLEVRTGGGRAPDKRMP